MFSLRDLPRTATAPFCPSEVSGTIAISDSQPFWVKLLKFVGPGLLVSVGYMDPGNWATDIEAGSRYGYALLFVVLFSSVAAILLQCLSLRLGIATGKDLARLSRDRYHRKVNLSFWFLAELAIIATDLAEVLGSALAFKLLFGCSLLVGIGLTAVDTIFVLGLKGKGFRDVEAIILGLVLTIAGCFFVELLWLKPSWSMIAQGFAPNLHLLGGRDPLYVAIGIIGATVMPHNLYLHSSIVQTRKITGTQFAKREAMTFATIDTVLSLIVAMVVNSAILILAAVAFHATGHRQVTEIQDAYHLLEPIVGTAFAAVLFGVALLASGQSSTFTGTIAGQVLMEGYLDLKIPCWKRRVITRGLALVPAFAAVAWMGEGAVGRLLVFSQVLLSLQLPFAIFPLIRLTSDRNLMGTFANGLTLKAGAWFLFALISAANIWMIWQVFS